MTAAPTTAAPQHGARTYFIHTVVEYYAPGARPSNYPSGFRVSGSADGLAVSWGFYEDESSAHAAARMLDRMLSAYMRLDGPEWRAAQARVWRWREAEALAEIGNAKDPRVFQYTLNAERIERAEPGIFS